MSLSTLCQSCGMCCDGTLFSQVPLTFAEALALRGADAAQSLPQPCAALDGTCCTIYAQRPARCRDYRCNLYAALADGEVDPIEALRVVEGARALIAEVAAAFGLSPEATEATEVIDVLPAARRRVRQQPPPAEGATEALARAERFLERHFRGRAG